MEFHERLKKVMKDSGIKNKDLMKACNVSSGAVSQWRNGDVKPKNLLCIAEAVEWDPKKLENYLIHGHKKEVQIAEEKITEAGFQVAYSPKGFVTLNIFKWTSADLVVSSSQSSLIVFVEIHPDKKLGFQIKPKNSKQLIYINESNVNNAGEILKEHFEKYKNEQEPITIEEAQAEYNINTLQNTGTLSNSYKTVPVVGMAQLGDNGYFEEQQYPVGHGDGYIDTPTTDQNAYGLKVVGDSMHPAIRHGWYVVIEPNLEPFNGMIALIKFKDGRKMIKELANSADGFYTLLSINEDHKRITANIEEIEDIHPVAFIAPPNKVKHL